MKVEPPPKQTEPEPFPDEDDNDFAAASESESGFDFNAPSAESEPAKKGTGKPAKKSRATAESVADNPFAITNLLAEDSPADKEKRAKEPPPEKFDADGKPIPTYRGPERSSNKVILIAGALGIFALVGGIAAVLTMIEHRKKEAEIKRQEEEARKLQANPPPPPAEPTPVVPVVPGVPPAPAPMVPVVPVPATPPAANPPMVEPPAPKGTPQPKDAAPPAKKAQGPIPGALTLPTSVRVFTVQPTASKSFDIGTMPALRGVLAAPLDKVRKLFPPEDDAERFAVLYQAKESAGLGKPEGLQLDRYFQGERQGKLTFDGDGKPPVCDLSHDATLFAIVTAGKLSVWDIGDGNKLGDPWDVYGKPEYAPLRTNGVVALFFSPDATMLATVASTGHVHQWEAKTGRLLGEFAPAPPASAIPVDGRAVTVDEGRKNVLVAIDGVVHSVAFPKTIPTGTTVAKLTSKVTNLGGIARVIGIGKQSSSDERLLVAVETVGEKPEKAIIRFKNGPDPPNMVRWPKDVGEPVAAAWASTFMAVVTTNTGAAILFHDEGKFSAAARILPTGKAIQAPTRGSEKHWMAISDPTDAKQTILAGVSMPFDGFEQLDFSKAAPTVRPNLK